MRYLMLQLGKAYGTITLVTLEAPTAPRTGQRAIIMTPLKGGQVESATPTTASQVEVELSYNYHEGLPREPRFWVSLSL